MRNKKSIMAFSAMQILLFHLWINIFKNNGLEVFLKQTAYIGVDIFFLLSGYSLASRKIDHYTKFLFARFRAIYVKYIVFALIAFIYAHWNINQLIKAICGVSLIEKGGGSFLWFIPTLMIFYIVFPLFQRCENKYKIVTLITTTLFWIAGAALITYNTELKQLAIIWNRIPIFLIGYYLSKLNDKKKLLDKTTFRLVAGTILTVLGMILIYHFAYKIKLQKPFADMFYIVVIPASIGLLLLVSNIKEIKPLKAIGSSTLELYAIQMIFGYDIANKVLLTTKSKILTDIITLTSVVAISVAVHYTYEYLTKLIQKLTIKNTSERG